MSAHPVVDDATVTGRQECGGNSVLDRAATLLGERFGLTRPTLRLERHAHAHHENPCH